ncbi:hypothetical protein [Ruoffia sp. FAM 20858]|uniref:hypothetical protein n=1 Tax=Ruoffia sp. FAM 20858 TaxID=3259516 RepID=UPI0038870BE8
MREMIDRLKQDIRELSPTSFTGKCKNDGGLDYILDYSYPDQADMGNLKEDEYYVDFLDVELLEELVIQYVLSWEPEGN